MPLGRRTEPYSTSVVMAEDETVATVGRNEDGELIYPLPGGQAVGVLEMTELLEGILDELKQIRAHLAVLTGEDITED